MTAEELIAKARKLWPNVEDDTSAALETLWGHGFVDQQLGDVDGFGRFYRVDRWIVETNSYGDHDVQDYGCEQAAIRAWDEIAADYGEWVRALVEGDGIGS